jgi:hypothetical protein
VSRKRNRIEGSDTTRVYAAPGLAVHQELPNLVNADLTSYDENPSELHFVREVRKGNASGMAGELK